MPKVNCLICGKEFYVKPCHLTLGWGKYCSKKCQFQAQRTGQIANCAYCGKSIYRKRRDLRRSKSGRVFCNKSCHCAWENKHRRIGIFAPNWRGGQYVYRDLMRKNKAQPICSICGYEDERVLVVHHKDGNRKNNQIENLEWLCRNCHYLLHNR